MKNIVHADTTKTRPKLLSLSLSLFLSVFVFSEHNKSEFPGLVFLGGWAVLLILLQKYKSDATRISDWLFFRDMSLFIIIIILLNEWIMLLYFSK